MTAFLPNRIAWPIQFVGFVLLAYAIWVGWRYGLETRGLIGALGGALLAFGLVGLAWFGLKKALGWLAEWLVVKTVQTMEARHPLVERDQ